MEPFILNEEAPHMEIWTEGKTDWKILQKAQEKLGIYPKVIFREYEGGDRGDSKLLQMLHAFAEKPNSVPLLFIFDRDVEGIIKEVDDSTNGFKNWGNNVYSFSIPIPDHRKGLQCACLELYFSDKEIMTPDVNNRRLFLTREFNPKSGKHNLDATISLGSRGVLKNCSDAKVKIIDSEVYNKENKNIALGKSDFADYIFKDVPPFDNFTYESFHPIFRKMDKIIESSLPKCTICLPDQSRLFSEINNIKDNRKYEALFGTITNVIELALTLFISATIRVYESIIVKESEYKKKTKPIVAALKDDFLQPSFKTLQELAFDCIHLINTSAPKDLMKMKQCLEHTIILGDIGQVIDDLEKLYPPESDTAIIINKPEIKKGIINYVIPELASYASKSSGNLKQTIDEKCNRIHLDPSKWGNALTMLLSELEPLLANTFVSKTLDKVDTQAQIYSVTITRYHGFIRQISTISIPAKDVEPYQSNLSEMILSDNTEIKLFPFAIIKDDSLFFYKKTQANGYEYYSLKDNKVIVYETKKKFNHSIFRTGSKQELFWTEAPPVINPNNGVKVNIPSEGPDGFVGRLRQKSSIFEELIEIPNQNGIIYGPGGIGKTALLINISKKMFELAKEEILFDNIVWVSAKSDYYDYLFDSVEQRKPQFQSLDTILFAVLEFFGFENLDEYEFNDKKDIFLGVLERNRILLILDNLETVLSSEIDKIVKFFEVEVKRKLRERPQNFKVIITSRKQVPSGLHQIELKGLDLNESKMLIDQLYEPYATVKITLTDLEKDKLYEVTKGIPIVIKHCMARVYEYNEPIHKVITDLSRIESNLVQFSYKEILEEIERDDQNKVQLQILLLLETVNRPLMLRQIADILEIDFDVVEKAVPVLADYQCLKRVNQDNQEKYYLNNEIRLLASSLAIQHRDLIRNIRHKLDINFSIDKQLDYTPEEKEITVVFQNYLRNGEILEAEIFIKGQIGKRPDSVLLKYHFAGYLAKQKKTSKAIEILEGILEHSGNNSNILKLLFSCYLSLEVIDFEKAKVYADQLEGALGNDEEVKLTIAEFYIKWSTYILKMPMKLDPLEEISRNSKIKTFALKALKVLDTIMSRTPSIYYLHSQGYYNASDYDSALRMINKAIKLSNQTTGDYPQSFRAFRNIVVQRWEQHVRH